MKKNAQGSQAFNVFDYSAYKVAISQYLAQFGSRGGQKTKFCVAVGIQNSYLSPVLTGKLHITSEQAFKAAEFMDLQGVELEYFLAVYDRDRAGPGQLSEYLTNKIDKLRAHEQRLEVKNSVTISDEDKAVYYSNWLHASVYAALTIPRIRTLNDITKFLQIPAGNILQSCELLIKCQLVEKKQGEYRLTKTRIHLGPNSPFADPHHIAWRIKAAEQISKKGKQDINYSAVLTLSKQDYSALRNIVIQWLRHLEAVVAPSTEETMIMFNLDLMQFGEN